MKSHLTGKGSKIVTDDAAMHVDTAANSGRRPIYDPSPLPEVPPGLTFSREHKRAMKDLIAPDDAEI